MSTQPHRNYGQHDPNNPNCRYSTSIGAASPDSDWCTCPPNEAEELRREIERLKLVFSFIAQEAKDGLLEVERGVTNAHTFWLKVIEKRATAARVNAETAGPLPNGLAFREILRAWGLGDVDRMNVLMMGAFLLEFGRAPEIDEPGGAT